MDEAFCNILVQELRFQDIPEVVELVHSTIIRDPCFDYAQRQKLLAVTSLEGTQTSLLSGHSVVYVDAEDKPIGFCSVAGNRIRFLFVNPKHQRRGIGGALLNYMERYSAGSDNSEESNKKLRVFSTESAAAFYEKHGYREIGRHYHMLDEVAVLRVEMMKSMYQVIRNTNV